MNLLDSVGRTRSVFLRTLILALVLAGAAAVTASGQAVPPPQPAAPQAAHQAGGEAALVLPDLGQVDFRGINARTLLTSGIGVCVLGLLFGLYIYVHVRRLPVHR